MAKTRFTTAAIALLLPLFPAISAAYMNNDLLTRYSSAYSLAEGSHNILYSDGISGIYYNPSRLVELGYPSVLVSFSAKGGTMTILNGVYAMPIGLFSASAFSANLLYLNDDGKNSLAPGVGFGTSFGIFETGASASLRYNLEQASTVEDFLFFKLAAAVKPGLFRFGCVFENETSEEGTFFLLRFQAGAGFLGNRIKVSAGLHQYFRRYYKPVINAGCEFTPWKFMSLGFNIEDWDPSFGFIFNSHPIKLCIAAWYHRAPARIFDYSISLTFRR